MSISDRGYVQVQWEDVGEGDRVSLGEATFYVDAVYDLGVRLSKGESTKLFPYSEMEWLGAEVYREAPELPKGLGAVVKLPNGLRYVRVEDSAWEHWQWWCADTGHGWLSHSQIMEAGFTVLTPGVTAEEGGEEGC